MDAKLSTVIERRVAKWLGGQLRGLQPAKGDESFAVGTEPGLIRKDNQDRVLYARFPGPKGGTAEFALVCDGIGGMADGGICAELTAAAMVRAVVFEKWAASPEAVFRNAVSDANRIVYSTAKGDGGSTLSAVLLHEGEAFVCHVGDTRVYALLSSGRVDQITVDDNVSAHLKAIGESPAELLPDHERLLQFVGMGTDLQAHVFRADLTDVFGLLLSSDGAHRIPPIMLESIARNAPNPRTLVERLLHLAQWCGGHDNASAVALRTYSTGKQPRLAGFDQSTTVELTGPSKTIELVFLAEANPTDSPNATSHGVAALHVEMGSRPTAPTKNRKRRPRDSYAKTHRALSIQVAQDLPGMGPDTPLLPNPNAPSSKPSTVVAPSSADATTSPPLQIEAATEPTHGDKGEG